MALKKLAAAAALLALSTPAIALDPADTGVSTMFYISIPLDFRLSNKERQQWSAGLQLQGKRDYPAIRIDTTMLNYFSLNDIDAKYMIAGLVAVGAAAAIGSKDKGSSPNSQPQVQPATTSGTQSAATSGATGGTSGGCTRPPTDPCKK